MRSCLLRSAEPAGVRNKQENHPRQRQHSDVSGAERPTWRTSKRQRGDDGGARECGSHPLGEAAFRTASIAPGGPTSLSKAVVIRHSAIRAASLPRIYGTAHVHRLLRYPRALLLLSHTAAVAFVVAAALRSQGELQRPIRGIARGASHCSSLQRRALPAAATPLARVQLAAACPPYCCTGAVVKAWSALGVEFVQHEDCDLHAGIPRGTAPEPCDVRMAGLAFSADPHWGLRRPLATRPLLKLWDLATPYYIASESPYRVWRRTSFTP